MNKEQLAEILDGRQYGNEVSEEIAEIAHESGLVIVYGYSDDVCLFAGAFDDEYNCFEGGTVRFDEKGVFRSECEEGEECPYFLKEYYKKKKLDIGWNTEGYSFVYTTTIPHATFRILEDGETYCRGIVFSINDVKGE